MRQGSAIRLEGLTKHYGSFAALDGLDLEVTAGEVHGFLGPNGAGKSTTLKAVLGLIRCDGGSAQVLGMDPWQNAVALHRRLAYVPGDVNLWPRLTGGEIIDLLGRLRGSVDPKRRDELIERFALDPRKKGRTYSKGNRQKVALVAALASDVELLLLDEPTSGLDPLMEATFGACVQEAKDRGTTVLLSSHILSEVEQLADRVTIIKNGRRIETGTLTELRHLTRTHIDATFARPLGDADRAELRTLAPQADVEGDRLKVDVEPDTAGDLVAHLASIGGGLVQLKAAPPSLEQLFLTHYESVNE